MLDCGGGGCLGLFLQCRDFICLAYLSCVVVFLVLGVR